MGTQPPAAVDGRISMEGRHDSNTAAPLSTTLSSLQGRAEVLPSRRIWSNWWLGRVQPGVQKSNPYALLVLMLRRPPCARESQCLLARLPPWRDVAAELHAPGILKAVPKVSISYPTSSIVVLKGSSSLDIHPPARVGQTRFFLLGGRGHCPRRQPRSPSVAF